MASFDQSVAFIKTLDSNVDEDRLKRLWDEKPFYAIQSNDTAARYFALVAHVGQQNATRVLQRAINDVPAVAVKYQVPVDGVLDTYVIETVNAIFPDRLIIQFRLQAAAYYKRLIERRPRLRKFAELYKQRGEK